MLHRATTTRRVGQVAPRALMKATKPWPDDCRKKNVLEQEVPAAARQTLTTEEVLLLAPRATTLTCGTPRLRTLVEPPTNVEFLAVSEVATRRNLHSRATVVVVIHSLNSELIEVTAVGIGRKNSQFNRRILF